MSKSLRFTDNGFSEVRKIYYYPAVQENHADAFSKSEVINFRFLSYHRAHSLPQHQASSQVYAFSCCIQCATAAQGADAVRRRFAVELALARASRTRLTRASMAFATETLRSCPRP
jgi:hypothetical protein